MELLKGNGALGDKAVIHLIMARCAPGCIIHGRRSTRVEEFWVRWEPRTCTFGEALEQCRLGFEVTSIRHLEVRVPSHALQRFVIAKRHNRNQRRALRRPPLSTPYIVQFVSSAQGLEHIRTIAGGAQALDAFLAAETQSPPTLDNLTSVKSRSALIKRCSSAQSLTRNKRRAYTPPPPPNPRGVARGRTSPPSLLPGLPRPPRRAHNGLLQIVMEEGDPNRDSTSRQGP